MSTYVTSRGTLLEAVHATINAFAISCGSRCNTLLLGKECLPDLSAATAGDLRMVERPLAGREPERLLGLRIMWVPGREVAVGNVVSLQ